MKRIRINIIVLSLALICALFAASAFAQEHPLLLRNPTLSKTQIAFSFAGDIWSVDRNGGEAHRLTSGIGNKHNPVFSPDGSTIAFTGEFEGNDDVYVIPAEGGVPRRLTYHPGADVAVGWSPDGKMVLFTSTRNSYSRFARLYAITVAGHGGFPYQLPLPTGVFGSYSPDAKRIAYSPFPSQQAWKRYRGGETTPIWITDLKSLDTVKIPRADSNDTNPMYIGDSVYFLSDRSGPITLFKYEGATKAVAEVLPNSGLDMRNANAGPGGIVYEQFGEIHLYDLAAKKEHRVNIAIHSDLPATRPHMAAVNARRIQNAEISPTGVRALFEARGEIFTVPAEHGDTRNLTNTPGAEERDPAWAPDGKSIAYFGDEGGEYKLYVVPQDGLGAKKVISLDQHPSFYYRPTWSPDSKKIAYTDKHMNLWYVDLSSASPAPVKVDTDIFEVPDISIEPAWSPDNKWIAYSRQLKSHYHAVFAYSLEGKNSVQITDGMSDAISPAWDKEGKYLYFLASTDYGPTAGWLDLSSFGHSITRHVYLAVLSKDTPSPIAPESDEEKSAEEEKKPAGVFSLAQQSDDYASSQDKDKQEEPQESEANGKEKGVKPPAKPVVVKLDADGIGQRIIALPIPPADFQRVTAGKAGTIFLTDVPAGTPIRRPTLDVQRFDLKTRKTEKVISGVQIARISADGEKILYEKQPGKWFISKTKAAEAKPGAPDGALKMDGMQAYIDPSAEWAQMFHETWRIERDFLYDPHAHGYDLAEAEKYYSRYLPGLGSREDLDYLFTEMLGQLTLGHVFIRHGQQPDEGAPIKGGLLGADYKVVNGRYQFAKVYNGENWNPELHAPLTQPGVNVKAGEYLLAVNGREVKADQNLFSYFEGTAKHSVVLKVGPNADGTGAREVTVVPVDSETGLRNLDWIESNRRKVEEMSGGKVAYVYLPDTATGGYTFFNRYYFSQVDKQAAVIDERYNSGGELADYIIDYMRKPIMSMVAGRDGIDQSEPVGSIYGPKVMIINESAGSGGDAMPWYFRKASVGKLIGTRTWGGLVGIFGYPVLMDGGMITAPRVGIYGLNGEWEIENHGVDPDVQVEMDPKSVAAGHDPQLEMAVKTVLEELKDHPLPTYKRPAFPNYHQNTLFAGHEVKSSEGKGEQ